MDISQINTIATSLAAAKDIAKALVGMRDGHLVNEATARLMQQLLDAQNALFAHNAALLQLQAEHFKSANEVVRLKEALDERTRYTLVELSPGHFALRMHQPPGLCGAISPGTTEPGHCVCQSCFSSGRKVVLSAGQHKFTDGWSAALICPACGHAVKTG